MLKYEKEQYVMLIFISIMLVGSVISTCYLLNYDPKLNNNPRLTIQEERLLHKLLNEED